MSSEQEQTERFFPLNRYDPTGPWCWQLGICWPGFYLEKKLEVKTKQIEQKIKIDKEVVQLKYKGNQKQYELNAESDSIIESTETESERGEPNLPLI